MSDNVTGNLTTAPLSSVSSKTDVAFLQRRVALFGLVAGALGLAFFLFRIVGGILTDCLAAYIQDPSMALHFAGAGALIGVWLVCRGGPRTRRVVEAVETFGLLLSCAAYAAMGLYLPTLSSPHKTVVLALTYAMVLRAVFVPSTARRAAILGGVIGIAVTAFAWIGYQRMPDGEWDVVARTFGLESRNQMSTMLAIEGAVWWSLTVVASAAIAKVIYGLRKEVSHVRRLGQYTLDVKLGQGGMGTVYQASHAMLRRPTAVKLLNPERFDESSLRRFEREVQLTALLTHPNTVTIYDYGRTPDGVFYYAMEHIEGLTLGEVVERAGRLPPARIVSVLEQVAGALAEAHGEGLIHRDIKPANIMLCTRGGVHDVVKVLDFGLVKHVDGPQGDSVTHADAVTGTPQYMAPEAITDGRRVDARADLYALGAVAYYLLTGAHVFTGENVIALCMHHLKTPPMPPSERVEGVPPDLEALILACLAKEPGERPQSADAFLEILRACRDAGRWTPADASEWWSRDGQTALSVRERSPVSDGATLFNVDLKRRS